MKTLRRLSVCSLSLLSLPIVCVRAEDSAIGLYSPDLQAMRRLVAPTGAVNLPPGPGYREVAGAWNGLSRRGRELLLREHDVVLVVVDSNGDWLYRSSGIHTLRRLYSGKDSRNPKDLECLLHIIESDWFNQLRRFFSGLLFASDSTSEATNFGAILTSVEKIKNANAEQKDWLRGIVGAEIQGMDSTARGRLLRHSVYGKEFVHAIAVADAKRNEQLKNLSAALAEGTSDTIDLSAIATCLDERQDDAEPKDVNVKVIDGRAVWVCNAQGQTLYVAPKHGDVKFPGRFTATEVTGLISSNNALVYIGFLGKPTIFKVETGAVKRP